MTPKLPATLAAALALSACSIQPPKVETAPGVTQQTGQFEFALPSGEYRCERGERLQIRRELANTVNNRIQLGWKGGQYLLVRDPSDSGLPRFEDSASGLVWIDLPWKGLLLEGYDRDEGKNCTYPPQTVVLQQKILAPAAPG